MNDLFIGDARTKANNTAMDLQLRLLEGLNGIEIDQGYIDQQTVNALSSLPHQPAPGYVPTAQHALSDVVYLNRETRQLTRGSMDVDTAYHEMTASDFVEGIWGENIQHQKFMATMTLGPKREWMETSLFFDVPDDWKPALEYFATTEAGNVTKIVDGQLPIYDLFEDDVAQLWELEQEGFTVKGALEELKAKDFELFQHYAFALQAVELSEPDAEGLTTMVPSLDILSDVVKNARNGHELMAKLNTTLQLAAIGRTMNQWESRTSALPKYWKHAKHFVVNGILDDPDLLGELVINGVLTIASGGLGAAGFAVSGARRINKVRNIIARTSNTLNLVKKLDWAEDKLSAAQSIIQNVNRFASLENFPSTILEMGPQGRWLKRTNKFMRGVSGVGINMAEGALSGGTAEWFNQRKKVMYKLADEKDWGAIFGEALLESIISPVLNPTLGFAFKLSVMTPGAVSGFGLSMVGRKDLANKFGKNMRFLAGFFDKDATKRAMLLNRELAEIEAAGYDLTGIEASDLTFANNGALNIVLKTIMDSSDLDANNTGMVNQHIQKVLEARKKSGDNSKISTAELGLLLADSMLKEFDQGGAFENSPISSEHVRELIELRMKTYQAWSSDNEGMTLDEYTDDMIKNKKYWKIVLPGTKAKVRERLGKAYDTASEELKIDTAAAIEAETDAAQRKLEREAEQALLEDTKEAEELGIDVYDSEESKYDRAAREFEEEPSDSEPPIEGEAMDKPIADEPDASKVEAEQERKPKKLTNVASIIHAAQNAADDANKKLSEAETEEEKKDIRVKIQKLDALIFKLNEHLEALDAIKGLDSEGCALQKKILNKTLDCLKLADEHRAANGEAINAYLVLYDPRNPKSVNGRLLSLTGKLFPRGGPSQIDVTALSESDIELLKKALPLVTNQGQAKFIDKILEEHAKGSKSKYVISKKKMTRLRDHIHSKAAEASRAIDATKEAKASKEAVTDWQKTKDEFETYRITSVLQKNREKRLAGEEVYLTARTWRTVLREINRRHDALDGHKAFLEGGRDTDGTEVQGEWDRRHDLGMAKRQRELIAEGQSEEDAQAMAMGEREDLGEITVDDLIEVMPRETDARLELQAEAKQLRTENEAIDTMFTDLYTQKRKEGMSVKDARDAARAEAGETTPSRTVPISEAKALWTQAEAQARENIRNFDLNTELIIAGEKLSLTSNEPHFIHNIPSDTSMPVIRTEADIIEQSTVGEAPYASSPLEYAKAWNDYAMQIMIIASSSQRDKQGYVEAWRLYAAMPDLFKAERRAPHVIFRDAISNSLERDVVTLGAEAASLKYRISKVVEIVKLEASRATSRIKKLRVKAQRAYDNIKERADKEYMTELEEAIEHLEDLQVAIQQLHTNEEGTGLFDIYGYQFELDVDTGGTILARSDLFGYESEADWEADYKFNVRERVQRSWKFLSEDQKEIILQEHGFLDFVRKDTSGTIDPRGTWSEERWAKFIVEDFLVPLLTDNLYRLNSELTMIKLANGKIDWLTPKQAADATVDYVMRKQLGDKAGRQVTKLKQALIGTEGDVRGGQAVGTTVPLEGDLHGAAPHGAQHAFDVVTDIIRRDALRAITEFDMSKATPKQRQLITKWLQKRVTEDGHELNLGEGPYPNFIPMPTHGHLRGKPMKMEDMVEYLKEFLYNMPAIFHSLNQDQDIQADGTHKRIREGLEVFLNELTTGTALIVPASQMEETIALEFMGGGEFEGLSQVALDKLFELEDLDMKRWAEENGSDPYDPEHFFSSDTSFDQSVSVIRIMDILGKVANENGQQIIAEIRDGVVDEVFKGNLEDYWLKGGHILRFHLEERLNKSGDPHLEESLRPLSKMLAVLDEVTLENKNETMDGWSVEKRNWFLAAREFVKIPLMREQYGAGHPAYNREFRDDLGDGRQALLEMQKSYEQYQNSIGSPSTDTVDIDMLVDSLEGQLYEWDTTISNTLLKKAAQINPALRKSVIKYFELPYNAEHSLAAWKKIIGPKAVRDLSDPEVISKRLGRKLSLVDTHRKLLEAEISKIAEKLYKSSDKKARAKVVKKFKRIGLMREFLDNHPGELIPGDDSTGWGEYVEIATGNMQSWKDISIFEALNALNSSAHSLNAERWAMTDEGLGFLDMEVEDALGLEGDRIDLLQYMDGEMSENSLRNYIAHTLQFGNTQQRKRGRVAVDGKRWTEFYKTRIAEIEANFGRPATATERALIMGEFRTTQDPEGKSTGIWDGLDDPYRDMSADEFDTFVRDMILKQAMVHYASKESPPVPGVNYDGNNRVAAYTQAMRNWWEADQKRMPLIKKEIELEREMVQIAKDGGDKGIWADKWLQERGSEGRVYTEEGAVYLNRAMTPLNAVSERRRRGDARNLPNGKPRIHSALSSSSKGKQSLTPYSSRGVNFVQLMHLKRDQSEMTADIAKAAGIVADPKPEDITSMGWAPPYDLEALPSKMPLLEDVEVAIEMVTPEAGIRAAEIHRKVSIWANEAGLAERLEKDPSLYPHFYLAMRTSEVRSIIQGLIRKKYREMRVKHGPDWEMTGKKINWIEVRNTYLESLESIWSLSRHIYDATGKTLAFEDKLQPLYVLGEIGDQTWRDILLGDVLSNDVLNKEAIETGTVPSEGIRVYSKDLNENEGFMDPELLARTVIPAIVQSHDCQNLITSVFLRRYRAKAIEALFKGHPQFKRLMYEQNILDTDVLTRQEKKDLSAKIIELARMAGEKEIILDLTLEETAMEKGGMVISAIDSAENKVYVDSHGEVVRPVFTHAVELFAKDLVPSNTNTRGANVSIGISVDNVMLMFAINANRRFMDRIDMASITGKPYGAKKDPKTGSIVVNESPQQLLDNVTGFRLSEQTKEQMLTSEALDLLSRGTHKKIRNRKRKVESSQVEVLDLYALAHNSPKDMSSSWIESHIHALESKLRTWEARGVATPEIAALINNIRGEIEAARNTALSTQPLYKLKIITLAAVLDSNGKSHPAAEGTTPEEVAVFLDPDEYTIGDITRELVNAKERVATLSRLSDNKTLEFATYINEPIFWMSREYLSYAPNRANPGFRDFISWRYGGDTARVDKYFAEANHDTSEQDRATFYKAAGADMESQKVRADSFELTERNKWSGNLFKDPTFDILGTSERGKLDGLRVNHNFFIDKSRDPSRFADFIETEANEHFKDDLIGINRDISRMTEGHPDGDPVFTKTEAKLVRGLILRLYALNPANIKGIRLTNSKEHGVAARVRLEDGSYVIRVGNRIRSIGGMSGDVDATYGKLSVVEAITHELGHITTQKWIKENGLDWEEWKRIKGSTEGKSLITKLVKSFHGGVMNSQARKELDSYLADDRKGDHEFIAGMVSYYLLADHVEAVEDLSPEEYGVFDKMFNIVNRIINSMKDTLWDLRGVFVHFEEASPTMAKDLDLILQRTLGRDTVSWRHTQNEVGNEVADFDHHKAVAVYDSKPEMTRQDKKGRDEFEEDFDRFQILLDELENWRAENPGKTVNNFPDYREYNALDSKFNDADNPYGYNAEDKLTMGGTIYQHRKGMQVLESLGLMDGRGLNADLLVDMLTADKEGALTKLGPNEVRAACQYMVDTMYESHGGPVSEGLGGFMLDMSKRFQKATGTKSNILRSGFFTLLAGQTGINQAHGSPLIVLNLLASILDEQSVTTIGQSTNLSGTMSLSEAISRNSYWDNSIMKHEEELFKTQIPATLRFKGREDLKRNIAAEVWKLVDNDDFNLNIETDRERARRTIARIEGVKDPNLAQNQIVSLAADIKSYIEYLEAESKNAGKLGESGFLSKIPIRLRADIDTEGIGELSKTLDNSLYETMAFEAEEGRKIDPITLTATEGCLPRMESTGKFVKDLRNMSPFFRKWYEKEINRRRSEDAKAKLSIDDMISALDPGGTMLSESQKQTLFGEISRHHSGIMRDMLRGKILFSDLGASLQTHLTAKGTGRYMAILERSKNNNLSSIERRRMDYFRGDSVHLPKSLRVVTSDFTNPIEAHRMAVIAAAKKGLYMPTDTWVAPNPTSILNSDLKHYLNLMPTTIMSEFKKSIGSDITERSLLNAVFGIKGDFNSVLALFEKQAATREPVYNINGEEGSQQHFFHSGGNTRMEAGLQVLRQKHSFIKGVMGRLTYEDGKIEAILPFLPDVAKIAYGTNLSLATGLVEGGLNFVDQICHPLALWETLKSTPGITQLTHGMPTEQQRMIREDMLHITEILTQGYISDFEAFRVGQSGTGSLAQVYKVMRGATKNLGILNVKGAHFMLKSIVYSRTTALRKFIDKNMQNGKIDRLVEELDALYTKNPNDINQLTQRLEADDSDLFFNTCKKVGIVGKWFGNREVARYLLRAGLLRKDKFKILRSMMGHGDVNDSLRSDKSTLYMINDMRMELESKTALRLRGADNSTTNAQDDSYRAQVEVMQGLRQVERLYIEDVILNPQGFDMYTGKSSFAHAFETYTRYPTLFAAMAVIRRSGRLTPLRFLRGLIASAALDMLYMQLLQTVYPRGYERVEERWRENPWLNFGKYSARLPMFGKYASMISDLSFALADDRKQWQGITPVGISGVVQMAENLIEGGEMALEGYTPEAMEKAWRYMGPLGDIMIRLAYFNFLRQERKTGNTADEEELGTPSGVEDPSYDPSQYSMRLDEFQQRFGKTDEEMLAILEQDFEAMYAGPGGDIAMMSNLLDEFKRVAPGFESMPAFTSPPEGREGMEVNAPKPQAERPTPIQPDPLRDVFSKLSASSSGSSSKLADALDL